MSQLVTPATRLIGLMVTVLAVVSVAGVASARAAYERAEAYERIEIHHDEVLVDLAGLADAVQAWAASGVVGQQGRYQSLRGRLREDLQELRDAVAGSGDLTTDALAFSASVEEWVLRYGDPRMAAPGGEGTFRPVRFAEGQQLLAQTRGTSDVVQESVLAARSRADDAGRLRLEVTIGLVLLLLGTTWILIGRARTSLLAELSTPLNALERVVGRMLRGDPEARADADRGPKELRAVARVLNDFADAQSRARAVEGRIQDELHVLDSAKDDFVSNVSHELRTPLTTISGYLEMVADEFEDRLDHRHQRMLDATRRNVTRLRALIDDLLALSAAENRGGTQDETADVVALVADAVTDVRIMASRRGIVVDVSAPDTPLPVVGDRAMLYRAFLNVLSNAVKFSHDGGRVAVRVRRAGTRVEVEVKDDGIGIPRTEIDRLGTRFFRASNAMSNEIAGTGLGLRIVQTIIDRHSGDVIISSVEGKGTSVLVRLRLTPTRVDGLEGLEGPEGEPGPPVPPPVSLADRRAEQAGQAGAVGATRNYRDRPDVV
ncbi:sensor histidine kinase [Nocardioides sp.]|uniref:sensor histidine kinase n=1 Tax=Nocardioides sp. TaxID=35761 RepID=UPI003511D4F6